MSGGGFGNMYLQPWSSTTSENQCLPPQHPQLFESKLQTEISANFNLTPCEVTDRKINPETVYHNTF